MAIEFLPTPISEIQQIYERLTTTFKSGVTRPLAYRRKQLIQLGRMLQENQTTFEDVHYLDFNKPRIEIALNDMAGPLIAVKYALEHLEEWARPEKPEVEAWRRSWDTTIHKVPKGVALIIAPFNYPIALSFMPMVGAIAAGCPVVLKPSEATPNVSTLMAKLVPKYLDTTAYAVVNGSVPEASALLDLRWDHIYFTGGPKVGRIVAAAAAKHITPVTLELGGKSPVIIDTECDLELAAKRTLYGKLQNMGQVCVSPDYVLVPRSIAPAFREALKKWYETFWPKGTLHESAQWGKIVNSAAHQRIKGLIQQTKGKVILGGEITDDGRIALTIVSGVSEDDSLMQEEIFGPVLPLIEVDSVDDAISFVAERPIPLAIYAFTQNPDTKKKVIEKTNSGRLAFNETFASLAGQELPFGGHGHSGYGSTTGKFTFDAFTHSRGATDVPAEMEPFFEARYPPHSDEKYKMMTQGVKVTLPDA